MNKKLILGTMLFTSIFGMNIFSYETYAVEQNIKIDSYENLINKEKYENVLPSSYSVSISDEIIKDNMKDSASKVFNNIGLSINSVKVGVTSDSPSYDLRDRISIDVKNQGNTESCWAFSLLTSMETNSKLRKGTNKLFSVRHMDYATSNSFNDGDNELAFNREVQDGGSSIIGLAYLTNGQGAVLEDEMPFENNMNKISLKDINIKPNYYVKGYETLPTIYKSINNNEIVYSNGAEKTYTYEEVCALRKIIKQHILDYGAVTAYTCSGSIQSYSNPDIINAKAYCCKDPKANPDHAVTIIGWDDNYSKDNFTGQYKPSKNGAYLVLNSYSDKYFENGYLWISYEDVLIETLLYGITESEEITYDNLYQHSFYGANIPISITSNDAELKEGYIANVFNRDSKENEVLNEVAVSTNQYSKFEVYVNSKNGDTNINNMQKVAQTGVLNPGYNTIAITPTMLEGSQFSIVIKQTSINENAYFMVEAEVDDTFFANTTANKGDSKLSIDGINWIDLSDLGTIQYSGFDVDLSKADFCIKGFTTNKSISSSDYKISQDNYITKVYDNTKISEFLEKTSITSDNYQFLDTKGNIITDYNSLIQTGMNLKVNDENYTLVVRGDTNGDGKISLIDISKLVAHYSGIKGFILENSYEKACDINLDNSISIIDLSQLLVLFNKM